MTCYRTNSVEGDLRLKKELATNKQGSEEELIRFAPVNNAVETEDETRDPTLSVAIPANLVPHSAQNTQSLDVGKTNILALEACPVESFPTPVCVSSAFREHKIDSITCHHHPPAIDSLDHQPSHSIHRRGFRIPGVVKRLFKRDFVSEKDMNDLFAQDCFITFLFCRRGDYQWQELPSIGNIKMRQSQMHKMLMQPSGIQFWERLCFHEWAESTTLKQILNAASNARKTLLQLKRIKTPRSTLWKHRDKVLLAVIMNEPISQPHVQDSDSVQFSLPPAGRAQTPISNSVTMRSNPHSFTLDDQTVESEELLPYSAYTIHPRISQYSYKPPDWVSAHISRQYFSKSHIIERIVELNAAGSPAITKLLGLTMLQQEQIKILIDCKNSADDHVLWSLGQLEVIYKSSIGKISHEVQSMTLYLTGDLVKAPDTYLSNIARAASPSASGKSETIENINIYDDFPFGDLQNQETEMETELTTMNNEEPELTHSNRPTQDNTDPEIKEKDQQGMQDATPDSYETLDISPVTTPVMKTYAIPLH